MKTDKSIESERNDVENARTELPTNKRDETLKLVVKRLRVRTLVTAGVAAGCEGHGACITN
jgi:hypothetical protein